MYRQLKAQKTSSIDIFHWINTFIREKLYPLIFRIWISKIFDFIFIKTYRIIIFINQIDKYLFKFLNTLTCRFVWFLFNSLVESIVVCCTFMESFICEQLYCTNLNSNSESFILGQSNSLTYFSYDVVFFQWQKIFWLFQIYIFYSFHFHLRFFSFFTNHLD